MLHTLVLIQIMAAYFFIDRSQSAVELIIDWKLRLSDSALVSLMLFVCYHFTNTIPVAFRVSSRVDPRRRN
jgi:hypothetical protein